MAKSNDSMIGRRWVEREWDKAQISDIICWVPDNDVGGDVDPESMLGLGGNHLY